jgi:YD repeat-containing protein
VRSRFIDAAGRTLSTTDQLGRVTRFTLDKLNRTTKVTDALGGETSCSVPQLQRSGLLLISLVLALEVACSRGPELVVINNSPEIVSNVVVKFTGGEAGIGRVRPGESRRVRIKSRGESNAVMTFADSKGIVHEKLLDVYFEPSYRGSLRVTIGASLDVTWKSDLSP